MQTRVKFKYFRSQNLHQVYKYKDSKHEERIQVAREKLWTGRERARQFFELGIEIFLLINVILKKPILKKYYKY